MSFGVTAFTFCTYVESHESPSPCKFTNRNWLINAPREEFCKMKFPERKFWIPFSSASDGGSFCSRSTSPKISFSDGPVYCVVTSAISTQYESWYRRETWLDGEYV